LRIRIWRNSLNPECTVKDKIDWKMKKMCFWSITSGDWSIPLFSTCSKFHLENNKNNKSEKILKWCSLCWRWNTHTYLLNRCIQSSLPKFSSHSNSVGWRRRCRIGFVDFDQYNKLNISVWTKPFSRILTKLTKTFWHTNFNNNIWPRISLSQQNNI
jgi:hypothetical protein